MKTKILFFSLLSVLTTLVLQINTVFSDTSVSGFISTNTSWTLSGSPYIVVDGVIVKAGVTLTIEPGVVVKANNEKAIQIDGELIAAGEVDNLITFTSNQENPAPGDWGYLHFTDSSVDAVLDSNNYVSGSILKYCKFEFGGNLVISRNPPSSGVVRIHGSSPLVTRCLIENNDSSGIEIRDGGAPTISYNTIRNNFGRNGGGIFALSDGAVVITNNSIRNNSVATKYASGEGPGGGGIFSWGDLIKIDRNIVRNNFAVVGGGIYVEGSSVTNNIVVYNSTDFLDGGGIYALAGAARVEYNIIANNSAKEGSAGVYARRDTTITNNSIVGNTLDHPVHIVNTDAAGAVLFGATFTYNTLTGNTVPEETDVGGISTFWTSGVINNNNIFNNSGYAFSNDEDETSANINAKNNWWGTSNESEIQDMIFDWFDDGSVGLVDYTPFETTIRSDVPISPPTGLTATKNETSILLSWAENPETDKAGYIVYWGLKSEFPYTNSENINNSTSYSITGVTDDIYYITVTAYDSGYNPAHDDPATIINENQTNGNESWYAKEVIIGQKISSQLSILYMVLPSITNPKKPNSKD
jgi:Right handed beta helix region